MDVDHPSASVCPRATAHAGGNLSTDPPVFKKRISVLCDYCQALVDAWSDVLGGCKTTFDHHENLTAIKDSAANGCSLCFQFLRGFEEIDTWFDPSDEDLSAPTRGLIIIRSKARYFWPSDWKRLVLVTPYFNGDFDSGYDEWSDTEAIFLSHEVDMIPSLVEGMISSLIVLQCSAQRS